MKQEGEPQQYDYRDSLTTKVVFSEEAQKLFTPREQELIVLRLNHYTARQSAIALKLSMETVKTHLSHIIHKTPYRKHRGKMWAKILEQEGLIEKRDENE